MNNIETQEIKTQNTIKSSIHLPEIKSSEKIDKQTTLISGKQSIVILPQNIINKSIK